jgi:uncharacterized protein
VTSPVWLRAAGQLAVRGLVAVIELYRHMVSPLRPATCRFVPTCSQYAVDALTEYGLVRGTGLTAARLARCGPWHPGGWDPIPDRENVENASGVRDVPTPRGESGSFV